MTKQDRIITENNRKGGYMNKIETMFNDVLNLIISSESEKVYLLKSGMECKYRISNLDVDYFGENVKVLDITIQENNFKISTILNFYSNNDHECLVSGYIPDFKIEVGNTDKGYVIEIDGYKWHEKTKEQAINDRKKDRAYIKSGFLPIRFLGSEVYHDAKKCVEEVIEIIIENELSITSSEKYQEMEINNQFLQHEVNELNEYAKCVFGFNTIKPLNIKNHTSITTPLEYCKA